MAQENNNQIIAASHSEVLLNEAADRDVVVAFVGKPHRIDDKGKARFLRLLEISALITIIRLKRLVALYLEGSNRSGDT